MRGAVELLPSGQEQLLDRYQLVGEIASGGMATVFLARLAGVAGFQRLVAIKRLHPHLAHEQAFVEMFLDEARLAARIHHKNVVPILEIGSSGGGYYLVMEYVEGVNFARLLTQATAKQQPIARPVLMRIVIDALSGLHAAHELTDDRGESLAVVHRDCSPQNILIGVDGSTKITDFGIARATARLHNTREGSMKGKLAYMAPEQTHGDGFDHRADLFSVGVVLWEVLSSRRLFKGTTEAQTLRRLLHDPIPHVSDIVGDIHVAYDTLCAKALQREPADRFQTAAEMADAIERAAREAGESVASERAVEALMKERYGDDVAQQRDALRTWMQATPTAFDELERTTQKGRRHAPPSDEGAISDAPETRRGIGHPGGAPPPPPRRAPKSSPPVDGQPDTNRRWPRGKPRPAPHVAIGAPKSPDEDETLIYDPTSTTGVTAEPDDEGFLTPLTPITAPSPEYEPPRARRWPWVVAACGAVAVGVLGVVIARSAMFSSAAPSSTPAPAGTSAAQPAPRATSSAAPAMPATAAPTEAASAPSASVTAPSREAPSVSRIASRPPAAQSAAAPVVRPAPARPPSQRPKPAPKPSDLDDLSNPYR